MNIFGDLKYDQPSLEPQITAMRRRFERLLEYLEVEEHYYPSRTVYEKKSKRRVK